MQWSCMSLQSLHYSSEVDFHVASGCTCNVKLNYSEALADFLYLDVVQKNIFWIALKNIIFYEDARWHLNGIVSQPGDNVVTSGIWAIM